MLDFVDLIKMLLLIVYL